MRLDLSARFWMKVQRTEACWLWRSNVDACGYGRFQIGKRNRPAHRVAWTLERGPIPEGLEIDHLCRVRNCVNPDHLEPVTHAENVRRGMAGAVNGARLRAMTACKRGHPFTDENTYHHDGQRHCKACRALLARLRRANERESA